MFKFFKEMGESGKFKALPPEFREIVFYSEGQGDWPHLRPLVENLLTQPNAKVAYLTSEDRDPGLKVQHPNFRAFNIGSGAARTTLFKTIEAKKFVMTMPDIETFFLKRSINPVQYIYVFHSIVSTHTIYRKGALDAFDTILCVGPHHIDEIRKTEKVYGLKPKRLLEHGSCKLDSVIQQYSKSPSETAKSDSGRKTVLIAPSWGEGSLIENPAGREALNALVDAGYDVILRLHPMTVRRFPKLIGDLRKEFKGKSLEVEENMSATESWMKSDIMISDWSGAALEYAFALFKPVLYIDMPQKINNPEWQKVDAKPFEDFVRHEIGRVLRPDQLDQLAQAVKTAIDSRESGREAIRKARDHWVFNVGQSAEVGANLILS